MKKRRPENESDPENLRIPDLSPPMGDDLSMELYRDRDLADLYQSLVDRGPRLLLGIDDRMLFPRGGRSMIRRYRMVIEIEADSDPREWLFEDRLIVDHYRIESIDPLEEEGNK